MQYLEGVNPNFPLAALGTWGNKRFLIFGRFCPLFFPEMPPILLEMCPIHLWPVRYRCLGMRRGCNSFKFDQRVGCETSYPRVTLKLNPKENVKKAFSLQK